MGRTPRIPRAPLWTEVPVGHAPERNGSRCAALGVGVGLIDLPSESFLDGQDPFVLDGEDGCGDITPTPIVPVPVTGPAGLLALIGLLAAAGVFVLLRRR